LAGWEICLEKLFDAFLLSSSTNTWSKYTRERFSEQHKSFDSCCCYCRSEMAIEKTVSNPLKPVWQFTHFTRNRSARLLYLAFSVWCIQAKLIPSKIRVSRCCLIFSFFRLMEYH
jgi:hypothetical protein